MIPFTIKKWFLFFIFIFTPLICFAVVPNWQIIPSESSLTFTGTQNNAPVTGKFKKFTGDIQFDPEQLDSSNVHIIIDMASIATSYSDLTDALISSDWLGVKIFPQAEFKASKFKKISDNTYEADGTLTIRDKTIPLNLTFNAETLSKSKVKVNGEADLKRSIFGIGQGEWANTDEVKDEVKVKFTLTAIRK